MKEEVWDMKRGHKGPFSFALREICPRAELQAFGIFTRLRFPRHVLLTDSLPQ